MATLAMVGAGTVIVCIALWIAISQARIAAKAQASEDLSRRSARARAAMDNLTSHGVGRRRRLVDFLKRKENKREDNS